MTSVHLVSKDSIFVGTETHNYKIGLFDQAQPNKYFRLDPSGFESIELLGIAKTGLTLAEFAADVEADGSSLRDMSVRFALATPTDATIAICQSHLASGVLPGDANMDGTFDSSDLTQIFQAGEYFDDIPGNSDWGDGDWNCDAEFNSSDLVAAFQVGHYVRSALQAVAGPQLYHQNDSESKKVDTVTMGDTQLVADANVQLVLSEHVDRRSLFEHNDRNGTRINAAIDTVMASIDL
jgi:hypothetical protein